MAGLIYGQVFGQLAWTLALVAAPFYALELHRPELLPLGVGLVQGFRALLPWVSRWGSRPGLALFLAHVVAGVCLLVALFLRVPLWAYAGAGLAGAFEGWLGPVLLRLRLSGTGFDRASGLYIAIGVAVPTLAWGPAGALVAAMGPALLLLASGVLFLARAFVLAGALALRGAPPRGGARRRGLVLALPFFLLFMPLGTLAARLPPVLGPERYALYNQLFALGMAAGGWLAGRRRLDLAGAGLLLAAAVFTLWEGFYFAGGALFGLGLGGLQVAGLGFFVRRYSGQDFAEILAVLGAAGALGAGVGAFLTDLEAVLWAPLLGLFWGFFTLRSGRRP